MRFYQVVEGSQQCSQMGERQHGGVCIGIWGAKRYRQIEKDGGKR